ncbi:MAG: helix-turn-helix transcriptional regulator [Bdellovibrionaceae bacterium]|jgi:transcriptional regulator with XRE-family HTH domain|nr:helix-turn-helix transcriptional regulator [Pseudobdellovibrionaceae bacterium]
MSSAVINFKQNLINIMQEEGISQKSLAHKVDIVPQALNKYLKGRRVPGLEVIDKFAKALQVPPHELIKDSADTLGTFLSKNEVYEAYLVAHKNSQNQTLFNGLSVGSVEELLKMVSQFGGWDRLYHFLNEENLIKEKGKRAYLEAEDQIFGPSAKEIPADTACNSPASSLREK